MSRSDIALRQELQELKNALHELDRQRDALQGQLDQRGQDLASVQSKNIELVACVQRMQLELQAARQQWELERVAKEGIEKDYEVVRVQLETCARERDALRVQLDTQRQEGGRLSEDVRALTRENNAVSVSRAQLSEQLSRLQQEMRTQAAVIGRLENELTAKELERSNLVKSFEGLASERAALHAALHEAETTCETLRAAVAAREAQITSLSEQLHSAIESNQNLATNLETTHIHYQALADELSRSQEAIRQFQDNQQQFGLRMDRIGAKFPRVQDCASEREAHAMITQAAADKQARLENEIARVSALAAALQEERDMHQAQASAAERLAADERRRVGELETLLAQERADRCTLQAQIEELRGELQRRDAQLKKAQSEVEARSRQCSQLVDTQTQAEAQCAALRKQLEDAALARDEAATLASRAQLSTRPLEATIKNLQGALERSQQEAAALRVELNTVRASHANELGRAQSDAEKRIGDLEAELAAVRQSYSSLSADHARMRELYSALLLGTPSRHTGDGTGPPGGTSLLPTATQQLSTIATPNATAGSILAAVGVGPTGGVGMPARALTPAGAPTGLSGKPPTPQPFVPAVPSSMPRAGIQFSAAPLFPPPFDRRAPPTNRTAFTASEFHASSTAPSSPAHSAPPPRLSHHAASNP